jgi:hypothetical protein
MLQEGEAVMSNLGTQKISADYQKSIIYLIKV